MTIVAETVEWVVIVTRPMSEEIAEKALRQFGYRVYLPRFRKILYPSGIVKRPAFSMRPRFPGYLFAEEWLGWPSEPIRGVIGLMRVGTQPAKISDQDIHKLRGKEWRGELDDRRPDDRPMKRDDLEEGDQVAIELAGNRILAVIEDLDDNGKAIIRAMMFGSEVRTRVDQRELEAVTA